MAQSISSKQEDFTSNQSYVYTQSLPNICNDVGTFENGRQMDCFRKKIQKGQEEYKLVLVLYPAGYDTKNKNHVALHVFIDQNITHKVVADVAICDKASKECFKTRVVLTKAYHNDGLIKNFMKKSDVSWGSKFLGIQNELKIVCRVVVCEGDEGKKLVSDASLLRNIHFDNYEKLLGNEEYSDFALKVGDTTFKVHKCILATHSSVFAAMFHHDMSEKNQGSTDITDVDAEVMKEFLRFIYSGKVEKLDELATKIWFVADKYDVNLLKEISEEKLIEKLNVDTISETLCLLDQFKMSKLKNAAIDYIIDNADQVKSDTKFEDTLRKLSSDLLTDVLYATLGKSKMS